MVQLAYSDDPSLAREGLKGYGDDSSFIASRLAASGGIPVGRLVTFDAGGDVEIGYLPSAAADVTDNPIGISLLDSSREQTVVTSDPLYPEGCSVPLLRRGAVWVISEDIVTAPGPVNVVFQNPVSGLGAFRFTASADTAVLGNARFMTITSAINELVLVEINNP